jgi:NADH:ubiquinone oxidoreductase subunit F (NADH-binding)
MSYYRAADLREHERHYGPIPLRGHRGRERPERLIDVVDRSGLTGRGGAGFPTGRKMRAVAGGRGPAVIVANGAEGEPASGKDRLLLTRLPHLVMDGISLAADAIGAREAYLCVHKRETDLLASLADAADSRHRAGVDPVPIGIVGIPGRYVSSEQSAITAFINGGPAKWPDTSRKKPPAGAGPASWAFLRWPMRSPISPTTVAVGGPWSRSACSRRSSRAAAPAVIPTG